MANEKLLIDPKELAKKIYEIRFRATGIRNGKTLLLEFAEKYRDEILRIICKAPSVDAVEVVRCKDCKHFNGALGRCDNVRGLCISNPNEFCSNGERRTI